MIVKNRFNSRDPTHINKSELAPGSYRMGSDQAAPSLEMVATS